MWLSKSELLIVIGLAAMAGCGGAGEDATAPDAAAVPVDPAVPVEMLGGGALTPIHDGQAGSPHVRVEWDVSGASISLTYGRPFLRGRTVGDSVEPLDGQVWRLGADEATTFTTDRDLMVGARARSGRRVHPVDDLERGHHGADPQPRDRPVGHRL